MKVIVTLPRTDIEFEVGLDQLDDLKADLREAVRDSENGRAKPKPGPRRAKAKKFACTVCGKRFDTSQGRALHNTRTHAASKEATS